jgi:hypothetical protein
MDWIGTSLLAGEQIKGLLLYIQEMMTAWTKVVAMETELDILQR